MLEEAHLFDAGSSDGIVAQVSEPAIRLQVGLGQEMAELTELRQRPTSSQCSGRPQRLMVNAPLHQSGPSPRHDQKPLVAGKWDATANDPPSDGAAGCDQEAGTTLAILLLPFDQMTAIITPGCGFKTKATAGSYQIERQGGKLGRSIVRLILFAESEAGRCGGSVGRSERFNPRSIGSSGRR